MSVLTIINGIPLYSTPAEALSYANANGLTGFHTHNYQGQTGYMGGVTHGAATNRSNNNNNNNNNNNSLPNPKSSSGGNGAGGASY